MGRPTVSRVPGKEVHSDILLRDCSGNICDFLTRISLNP